MVATILIQYLKVTFIKKKLFMKKSVIIFKKPGRFLHIYHKAYKASTWNHYGIIHFYFLGNVDAHHKIIVSHISIKSLYN